MIHILRVIPSLDIKLGGPMEVVIKTTPYLNSKNIKTTVATLDDPDSKYLKNLPFSTYGLGPVKTKYGYKKGISKRIKELAQNKDAVIIHGLWQYHSFATWRALKNTNIPYFVFTHGQLDPFFKNYFPLKHIKKSLYWFWADYKVLRDAKAVLFTSEQEKHLARRSFWLYDANEKVVGYGTGSPPDESEVSKDIFLSKYPHLRNKRIFLFLSRIDHKKGVDDLIKAFAHFGLKNKNLALVIAGPDPFGLKPKLQKLAENCFINKKITWTGMLRDDLKWSAYRSAELFCLPSHSENFGIVIAEALACGIPVATTNKVNIFKEIIDGQAGLIGDDNIKGFQNNLKKWLSLSNEDKFNMGLNAKNLFYEKYDLKRSQKKLVELLKECKNNG